MLAAPRHLEKVPLLEGEKLRINIGAHPALAFRSMPVSTNGITRDVIAKRNLPLSVSAMVNKTIQTRVVQSDDFLWNVSLNYSIKVN